MEPVFGIVSWLPSDKTGHFKRFNRVKHTVNQLHSYWPTIDIMILAQDWTDEDNSKIHAIAPNVKVLNYPKLGILQARKTLRQEFLKTNYGWIIMGDDDMIISVSREPGLEANCKAFLDAVYAHPQGFGFVKCETGDGWYPQIPYKSATLNLAVVSRYIYEQEDMVPYNIEIGEGCEDVLFPYLLHVKYAQFEFDLPKTITHLQNDFNPNQEPSTWVPTDNKEVEQLCQSLYHNNLQVMAYIDKYHDLPKH